MPHDKNGRLINTGDRVVIPAIVLQVMMQDEYCNVNLQTLEPMPGNGHHSQVTLNTRQVLKREPPSSADEDLAREAFEAFGDYVGWLTPDDRPIRPWEEQTPTRQAAWRASVAAALALAPAAAAQTSEVQADEIDEDPAPAGSGELEQQIVDLTAQLNAKDTQIEELEATLAKLQEDVDSLLEGEELDEDDEEDDEEDDDEAPASTEQGNPVG